MRRMFLEVERGKRKTEAESCMFVGLIAFEATV